MSRVNYVPFKVKKTFTLNNFRYEEGKDYELNFIEVEVLINEALVEIIPLQSIDYKKMLKEERESDKILKLKDNFFIHAMMSQRYLKGKSKLTEIDKKAYSESAAALRNFLQFRAEKILKALLIDNQKIEVHEDELVFISDIGKEISKWAKAKEAIVRGEKNEAYL